MAELAVCERLGVSLSHFHGGPALFTAQDRQKALAFHAYKASLCPGCGTERAEWDESQGGHPEAYIGGIHVCQMCAVLAQEARNIQALSEDRSEAADGARPVLRHRDSLPRDADGNVIDGKVTDDD
jgi:hypothetical protein